HNASRAMSGMVNIVGDHATYHRQYDAPLASDIEGLARPNSHWVKTSPDARAIAGDGALAIAAARQPPGKIATLILPADTAWNEGSGPANVPPPARPTPPSADAVEEAARVLRSGEPTLMLLTGRAALEARVVQVPDVLADPDYTWSGAQEIGGYRSAVGAPLLHKGNVVGVIFVAKKVPQPFTAKQIELVATFSDQALLASETTRLLNEFRESLQQQPATADVLKVISRSTFDLKSVLNTLVKSAARLCEADMAALARPKGSIYGYDAMFGHSPEHEAYLSTHPAGIDRGTAVGRTLVQGKIVHITDVLADPEYTYLEGQRLGGFRTLLGVPLLREGTPIGVIVVQRKTVRPFTDKQIGLVTTFADQAVIAIENARLLNELRESLQQQTATSEVLQVISSSPGELEPVFEAMLKHAVTICEAKFGVLYRYDGAFHVAASLGVPPAYAEYLRQRGSFLPTAGAPLDRLLQTKELVQSTDASIERNPGPAAQYGGARSLIGVPMRRENELVGAFIIYRTEVRPFTDKQIELATNFAAQAVIAIENTRL